ALDFIQSNQWQNSG
ncbi:hypothetical protein BV049_01052B, partial [Haemophilus influenzae]